MWGLEYAFLFGVPNNKLELIDGRSRCAFPFADRQQGEAHFAAWIETLCRWKRVATPPAVEKDPRHWKVDVAGFRLDLAPQPMDVRIPFDGDVFMTFYDASWRREMWGEQPPGRECGWEHPQRHYDVVLNLWQLFGSLCSRYGGLHSGRVDIALSDTAAVAPDQYYFRKSAEECMIGDDYFHGVPDLIAEVLSPASRPIDRGPRKELYRRVGVRHLWLLDPEIEAVEWYELTGSDYRLVKTGHAGEQLQSPLFPETTLSVDQLFDTQAKRKPHFFTPPEPASVPAWLVPREKRLGLEHLFLLGHPEKRWEIWQNRAPCVLPFGSVEEARLRFTHFLEDICRWEQASMPKPSSFDTDAEQAEVGRFRLTRRQRHVYMDVAVDARKYRELLEVWHRRDVWDWGED